MGELHLEIIRDRIRTKYKIEADVGPLQIAYKELLATSAKYTHSVKLNIGEIIFNLVHQEMNKTPKISILLFFLGSEVHAVKITLTVLPKENENDEFLVLDTAIDNSVNLNAISPKRLSVLRNGLEDGLQRGPKAGCPVSCWIFPLFFKRILFWVGEIENHVRFYRSLITKITIYF